MLSGCSFRKRHLTELGKVRVSRQRWFQAEEQASATHLKGRIALCLGNDQKAGVGVAKENEGVLRRKEIREVWG